MMNFMRPIAAGMALLALSLPVVAQAQETVRNGGKAEPFTVSVSEERIDHVMQRVRDHEYLPDAGIEPWKWGMSQSWLRQMGETWANGYDWRDAEDRLNAFDNFRADISGKKLHFIHERGSGDNPTPLLILHGWPYSVLTFTDVIEPLAHPERFGGKAEDAFDVVVVSLPGVGFSEAPDEIESLRQVGNRYHTLMTEVLGYNRYITHGGDQGAVTASWMARDFPEAVIGHHVHMFYPRHPASPWLSGKAGPESTQAEKDWVAAEAQGPFNQLAYILTHVARGETLAASVADSPVGQAAWIWDKWYYWTDRSSRSFDEIYSPTRLIDEVMFYIVTDSFRTSIWPYMSFSEENITTLEEGEMIDNPAGVTAWPDPVFPLPPREYVERSRSNLIHYTTPPRGGHFPMIEEPDLYVGDLRAFRAALGDAE